MSNDSVSGINSQTLLFGFLHQQLLPIHCLWHLGRSLCPSWFERNTLLRNRGTNCLLPLCEHLHDVVVPHQRSLFRRQACQYHGEPAVFPRPNALVFRWHSVFSSLLSQLSMVTLQVLDYVCILRDVYRFLGNRVLFFPIAPEYQLGPDFLYSNTITNRVQIEVGSDIFRIGSQN